jgi:alkylation response protein AidB-like acyl-CoA dehydrogenase
MKEPRVSRGSLLLGRTSRLCAMGFSRETLVEYCMRRTRGWMIAGGSVEILKNRIAEHAFDRRFDQRKRQPTAAE